MGFDFGSSTKRPVAVYDGN